MLRSVGAHFFAAALLLTSQSAFRQALSEFRDTEPGSLLFGALQLLIGTSALVAAIGLVKRTRWAAGAVAIWGVAAVVLLALQPLFAQMDADAQRSIWWGAAAVGVAAAGVSWFALGRSRGDAASHAAAARTLDVRTAPVLLAESRRTSEPVIARTLDEHVPRGTQRHDERPRASGASIDE